METVLLKCVSYLQQAVQKDPRFALAHATLAFCYVPLANLGFLPPWEAVPRIEKHARKALELDPELAEGHLALASSLFLQFDWAGAEAEYRKAIESNPGDAQVRLWYSFFLLDRGAVRRVPRPERPGPADRPLLPVALRTTTPRPWSNSAVATRRWREARQMVEIEPATRARSDGCTSVWAANRKRSRSSSGRDRKKASRASAPCEATRRACAPCWAGCTSERSSAMSRRSSSPCCTPPSARRTRRSPGSRKPTGRKRRG